MNAKPLPQLTTAEMSAFWANVEITDDAKACWNWTGTKRWSARTGITSHFYGVFTIRRDKKPRQVKAHRISKALHSADHPELDIDHTCLNKLCVNPLHLDWVTHRENKRRAWKRTCKKGHDISTPDKRTSEGWRCRQCSVESRRRSRERARAIAVLAQFDALLPQGIAPLLEDPLQKRCYSDPERSVSDAR